MHDFRKLKIWTISMDIVVDVYNLTSLFPKEEKFGLTSQLQRCAVSIPSNVAEGAGRNTNKDFAHFLSIATGSSYELETQLLLSERVKIAEERQILAIIEKLHLVQKMLFRFKNSLLIKK